jgi:uncharacterized membrane protein
MNPFDLRTVLLAKHAQHVALIQFSIALYIAAVALDLLGVWTKERISRQPATSTYRSPRSPFSPRF